MSEIHLIDQSKWIIIKWNKSNYVIIITTTINANITNNNILDKKSNK